MFLIRKTSVRYHTLIYMLLLFSTNWYIGTALQGKTSLLRLKQAVSIYFKRFSKIRPGYEFNELKYHLVPR